MQASAPVFAASFLITQVLTRTGTGSGVIVIVIVIWQALTVTLFSLPMAPSTQGHARSCTLSCTY